MSSSATPAVSQLGYVGIGASDPDAWVPLMCDVLGFQLAEKGPDGSLRFRADSHLYRIAVKADPADDVIQLSWQAAGPDRVEVIASSLASMGVAVEEGDDEAAAARGVQGFIAFQDPDGLSNEVFWGPHVHTEPMLPGRATSGFKAEELGLGHVVIATEDAPRATDFYCRGLGLQLSDFGSSTLTFLRCNPRHHSIAFKPVDSLEGRKRVFHAMVELETLDDVGRAFDLCLTNGVPLSTTIGKHVNDHAVSFYLESPSGFEIECACQGRLVDEETWEVHRYVTREVWGHQSIAKLLEALGGSES
jgi:2,3-dihydroxybiphenyl 1,2-dioxygenase